MSKPTAAQLAALMLATVDAIRYYCGGWYFPESIGGADVNRHGAPKGIMGTVPATLNACVTRGWISVITPSPGMYRQRWTITDAGRAELARKDTK